MASRREFSSTRFTRGVKDKCPDTSASSSMAQENMLGAHVGLMERTRLILSQDQHLACFVREFLE